MGVPYKLQRRRNPLKPTEPGQWHAVPKTGKAVKEKVMTRMATEDTTVADVELIAAAKLIGKFRLLIEKFLLYFMASVFMEVVLTAFADCVEIPVNDVLPDRINYAVD